MLSATLLRRGTNWRVGARITTLYYGSPELQHDTLQFTYPCLSPPDVDSVVTGYKHVWCVVCGVVCDVWCLSGGLAPHCSTVGTTVSSAFPPADQALRTSDYLLLRSILSLCPGHEGPCSTAALQLTDAQYLLRGSPG